MCLMIYIFYIIFILSFVFIFTIFIKICAEIYTVTCHLLISLILQRKTNSTLEFSSHLLVLLVRSVYCFFLFIPSKFNSILKIMWLDLSAPAPVLGAGIVYSGRSFTIPVALTDVLATEPFNKNSLNSLSVGIQPAIFFYTFKQNKSKVSIRQRFSLIYLFFVGL